MGLRMVSEFRGLFLEDGAVLFCVLSLLFLASVSPRTILSPALGAADG